MHIPSFTVPASAAEARKIQDNLRERIRLQDEVKSPQTIAGIDVGYDMAHNLAHASIVVMQLDNLTPLEQVQRFAPIPFPYVPGLLSFREIPVILEALSTLRTTADILMVDGQGIAHPRRMGIAAHLGVLLDMPSLGVAKSCLTGKFILPGLHKGDQTPLIADNEQIGVVLRSKDNVKPLFISPGHRISLATAVELTLQCLTRYRLPEPTRLADKFSKCNGKNISALF